MNTNILRKGRFLQSEIEAMTCHREQLLQCAEDSEGTIKKKYLDLAESITARIRKREQEIADFESAVAQIEDVEVRTMIQLYADGLDWDQVNMKVYGYRSDHACRKRVVRYLNNHPELLLLLES